LANLAQHSHVELILNLTVIMQTWRRLVHPFALFLAFLFALQLVVAHDVPLEDPAGLLPEGNGHLDGPIDFTNADDVMEKLGPVVSA
jgi:hypothetical protein